MPPSGPPNQFGPYTFKFSGKNATFLEKGYTSQFVPTKNQEPIQGLDINIIDTFNVEHYNVSQLQVREV